LGIRSVALGFVAGYTGEIIEKMLRNAGITTNFVHLQDGSSRINVKIKAGEETECNGNGPEITRAELSAFLHKLDELQESEILVLAGSLPNRLPSDLYSRIFERLSGKGIRIVVDAEGELLLNTLPYHPFLVKPNEQELGGLFGVTIQNEEEVIAYAARLREMGAQNVLVSRAGNGALLLDEFGHVHRQKACTGTMKNSVGAGDSMIAGFLAGLLHDRAPDYGYALKLGTAAGGATAFSEGLAVRSGIEKLLSTL
jgi:1-phosphofructokinase